MAVLQKILMIAGVIVLLPTALFVILALSVFVLQKCLTKAEIWKIFFEYHRNRKDFVEWKKSTKKN